MWDIFKEIMTSDVGSGVFAGGILTLLVIILFRGGRLWEKFNNHEENLKEMKKSTDSILSVKANHEILEKRFDKFESKIDSLTDSVRMMKIDLNNINKNDPLAQRNSPWSLTEKGKHMIESSGIMDIIDKNWNEINKIGEESGSRNPYDIQEFFIRECILHLDKFIGTDNVDKMKLYAYCEGVSIESIGRAIAIVIRDKYFQKNNINIDEVDKHDPHLQ